MEFNADVARTISRDSGNNVNLADVCASIQREARKGLYHVFTRALNPTEVYFLTQRGFTIVEKEYGNVFSTLITWTPEDY